MGRPMRGDAWERPKAGCDMCGGVVTRGRFCSAACREAYRVASGVDDVVRVCEACGGGFVADRRDRGRRPVCGLVCEEAVMAGPVTPAEAVTADA